MAFKRKASETFSTKVEVNIPNNKGGFDTSTFDAVFKRPTTEEFEEDVIGLKDKDLCRKYMVGWKLVDEDTKEQVPFSAEELEGLLLIAPTPAATAAAFVMAYRGIKAKN